MNIEKRTAIAEAEGYRHRRPSRSDSRGEDDFGSCGLADHAFSERSTCVRSSPSTTENDSPRRLVFSPSCWRTSIHSRRTRLARIKMRGLHLVPDTNPNPRCASQRPIKRARNPPDSTAWVANSCNARSLSRAPLHHPPHFDPPTIAELPVNPAGSRTRWTLPRSPQQQANVEGCPAIEK